MPEVNNDPSFFDKFRKNRIVTHTVAFGTGAAVFAVALRIHNGIAFNERIWGIPAEALRKQLMPGSSNLITNGQGVEYYITKLSTCRKK